ncbi:MAG: helix-turn-helix domain-containing protein [Patescibacteria group bacterium]|jgi:sugar-specific transcriptional regulator TrmB
MSYKDQLSTLGLSNMEIKAYLALLEIGSATVLKLSHKTGIKRTTMYDVVEGLIHKKLITLTEKGNKRSYHAENPKKIDGLLAEEERKLAEKRKNFLTIIPELSSLFNAHDKKPKIRFYEGFEGIKTAFEETLELPRNTETLAYGSAYQLDSLSYQEYILDYISRRVAKGIYQRAIINDSPVAAKKFQADDKAQLRNTILVDEKTFPFVDEVNIYGNKVSIVSFKDELTLIIESEAIARTQRSFFEMSWITAQQIGKLSPNPYVPPKREK